MFAYDVYLEESPHELQAFVRVVGVDVFLESASGYIFHLIDIIDQFDLPFNSLLELDIRTLHGFDFGVVVVILIAVVLFLELKRKGACIPE